MLEKLIQNNERRAEEELITGIANQIAMNGQMKKRTYK